MAFSCLSDVFAKTEYNVESIIYKLNEVQLMTERTFWLSKCTGHTKLRFLLFRLCFHVHIRKREMRMRMN